MKLQYRLPALALAAALLSSCGGGVSIGVGDFDDFDDFGFHPLFRLGRPASLEVASSEPLLAGTYSTSDVRVTDVLRFSADGPEPETCRFRFDGLEQAGSRRPLDGEIRYLPDSNELRSTIVFIGGFEFRLDGTTGATVDRTSHQVVYSGATLPSTQGNGQTVTLTGAVPMEQGRPGGC